jgi:hypothetical protein
VWLGALSWCRNNCPCHLQHLFIWTALRNHCKTSEMISNTVSRR